MGAKESSTLHAISVRGKLRCMRGISSQLPRTAQRLQGDADSENLFYARSRI
jgi:hypothetical protein